MEITFTGIKNVGYLKTSFNYAAMNIIKEDDKNWRRIQQISETEFGLEESYLLNIQLTDDFNGKHYTDFTEALKKAHLPYSKYKNPINKNFLNFFISREFYKENNRQFKDTEFIVNNTKLELKDKNLPFFSYLAKLVSEISHKPSGDFVVNRDYLESEDLNKGLCLGDELYAIFGKDYYDEVRAIHNPGTVKKGAKEIENVINTEMMEYFK